MSLELGCPATGPLLLPSMQSEGFCCPWVCAAVLFFELEGAEELEAG